MRKLNSKFKTNFISEAGTLLQNKDYFACVELDGYACYVIADGIDDDLELESAKIAITSIIRNFTEKPTIKKRIIKRFIKEANEELILESNYIRLKASITIAFTDYSKVVYATAGNARFYLFRDGVIRYKSKDQSMTQILVDKETVSLDKIGKHSERNNLFCYLGQNQLSKPYISKKIKLADGDIFALLTRGIWENVDDQEMAEAAAEAKDPKELTDNIEDLLLSKQLKDIENYTLASTFVDKVYLNPDKNKSLKKILMTALPVLLVIIILGVVWGINRNKKLSSIDEMKSHKNSGIEYTQYGNMTKASEEYKAALDIANKYKLKSDKEDLGKYSTMTEIILDADAKLKEGKYAEALDKYLLAKEKSEDINNVAEGYILKQLTTAKNAIKVADFLALGDKSLEAGNVEDAEKCYKQAKSLATDLYLKDEKKEALDKLDKIYAQKSADKDKAKAEEEKVKKEEEEALKKAEENKKAADEKLNKAIDLRKNGDLKYTAGDYVSAKMYYALAKEAFEEINSTSLADELNEKIALMDKKINETADKKGEADKYVQEADKKYLAGDTSSAKVLYLLAKDVYNSLGDADNVAKVTEKITAVEASAKTQT